MANDFLREIPLKALGKVHKKGYGRKNTTLICVTRKVLRAELNLKQQFDSLPFKLVL